MTGVIIIVGRTLDTISGNLFSLLTNPEIFGARRSTSSTRQARRPRRSSAAPCTSTPRTTLRVRGRSAVTVSDAYVDQATIIPEAFWDMLVTRLSVDGARLLATTKPGSRSHWLRKNWILKAQAKNLVHFAFTMDDNPSLSDQF